MKRHFNPTQAVLGFVIFLIASLVVGGAMWMAITLTEQSQELSRRAESTDVLVAQYADLYADARDEGVTTSAPTPDKVQEAAVQGRQGERGWPGSDGLNGVNGLNGKDGSNGSNGLDGLSIPGAPGVFGKDGTNGLDGVNGLNGTDGVNGAPGATGATGSPGRSIVSVTCTSAGTVTYTFDQAPLTTTMSVPCTPDAAPVVP